MSIDTLMNWGSPSHKYFSGAPRILDFNLYRNTTWDNTIEFKDTSDNTPIDISANTFTLTVKRNAYDTKVIRVLTLGNGLTIGGTNNEILTIVTLLNFKAGIYVYDLLGTTETGEIIPYLKGKIKLEENV